MSDQLMTNFNHNLVSIIVPCFNHSRFIAEAIDSILSQTYQHFECIIVDDGSTDDTVNIVNKYVDGDDRVRYIFQDNSGPAVARNTGLINSKGKYIQFLDADDIIVKDKIYKQVIEFEAKPHLDIIYSEYICFDDEDPNKTWTYSRVVFEGSPCNDLAANWGKSLSIPIHCFLYKKTCFERWGLFDSKFLKSHEDWDLHLTFAFAGAKYGYVPGQLSLYRVCKNSRARDAESMLKGEIILLKKYLFRPKLPFFSRLIFFKRYIEIKSLYLRLKYK